MNARVRRPVGEVTRGTTAPNRLRRVDRWIAAACGPALRSAGRPLVVDLGYGASPVTTLELFQRLRRLNSAVEVVGIEIDPGRVAAAQPWERPGLSFRLGGFELPVDRPPLVIRAFNVLRQYDEASAWTAWDLLSSKVAAGGFLVEGTCSENGRRAVWVRISDRSEPLETVFGVHLQSLGRPSDLAERLPKTLIHRNVPGEPVHALLTSFDRAWATAAPQSVFGPRQRWIAAVELLADHHPVLTRAPLGGRRRWRLGEVTVPWSTVAPQVR